MSYTSKIFVTVDIIVIRPSNDGPQLLLIQRKKEPFAGHWALPGGFVDEGEDLPDAARRELQEETGIEVFGLTQLGAFGKPGRDPRHHTVSVAFMTKVGASTIAVAADDAKNADWFTLDKLPPLAFDHADIVAEARKKLGI